MLSRLDVKIMQNRLFETHSQKKPTNDDAPLSQVTLLYDHKPNKGCDEHNTTITMNDTVIHM